MARILLLEDNLDLTRQLVILFGDLQHQVKSVGTVAAAREELKKHSFDLVLLDRALPDGDGLEVLTDLQHETDHIACIILSQRAQISERIKGLRLGALDYLAKPFSREELLLRVHNILRRELALPSQCLTYDNLRFWPSSGKLMIHDRPYQLRKREAQLMTVLLRHPGQTLTKAQLIQHVWQAQADQPEDDTIEVYVRRLRLRLPEADRGLIQTIRGYGYRLNCST